MTTTNVSLALNLNSTKLESRKKLTTLRITASPEERKLVAESRAGNRQAQRQLYEKYVQAMYHSILRMTGSAEDAEDVIQEAFARVFSNLHTFKGDSTLGAWIKRICINTCLNFLRKAQRMEYVELNERTDKAPVFEKNEQPKWNLKQIHESIKKLPEGCRVVFSLYLLEGYQHKEIAKILDITESTSKTQYRRAKRILREQLEGRQ